MRVRFVVGFVLALSTTATAHAAVPKPAANAAAKKIALPGHSPEYAVKLKDGRHLVVAADYSKGYSGFRAFIGKKGAMKETLVTGPVRRLRDGGTTFVPMARGMLHVASSFKGGQAQFDGEPVERLPDAGAAMKKLGFTKLVMK